MSPLHMVRFVVQQGLPEPAPHASELQYDALAFQPRALVVLVAGAAISSEPAAWGAIAGLLLLGAAAPRLNPFDALYAALHRRQSRRLFLPGARAPRRFAQVLPALFCLAAALALLEGREAVVWGVVVAFGLAFAGIFVFGFCFGAWLFRLLVPSWRPPTQRPARISSSGAAPLAGLAGGAGLRTPPRTPHAPSAPSQPWRGFPPIASR